MFILLAEFTDRPQGRFFFLLQEIRGLAQLGLLVVFEQFIKFHIMPDLVGLEVVLVLHDQTIQLH